MNKTVLWSVAATAMLSAMTASAAPSVIINLDLPKMDADGYHRPYVAVWVETPDRTPVATIALWKQKDKWLKDLRQWWRKAGREAGAGLDAVTGATRQPGSYRLEWAAINQQGSAVTPGNYLINIEAAREDGGREFVQQAIVLGQNGQFRLQGKSEIGAVLITVKK